MNKDQYSSKQNKTLGIAVPVYNTELNYLENCLESLRCDSGDYTVALVDDGSDAETASWCKSYCEKSPEEFFYIRQENSGQNAARMAGAQALHCDYVTFVDSDDSLAMGAIPILTETLQEKHPDVLIFGYNEKSPSADSSLVSKATLKKCKPQKKELLASRSSLWGSVFKRSIIVKLGLAIGFHIGEDFASFFDLVSACDNIVEIKANLYRYTIRPTSITQSSNYSYALEIIQAFDYLIARDRNDPYADELEWQAILHLLFWEPLRLIRSNQASTKNKKNLAGYMIKNFPNWRSNPYYLNKKNEFGLDFHLLVGGHWKLYKRLWGLKNMGSRKRAHAK